MPNNREISDELLEELEGGGGIQAKTQNAKDRGYAAFTDYIREVGGGEICDEDGEVIISDEDLEKHFGRYFFTLQVKRRIKNPDGTTEFKQDWPKAKTAEFSRSMIKCSFYERHGIDLTDPHRFPRAKKYYTSFQEKLKSEGRADTEHHEEIPPDTYEKITKLFYDAMQVIKNRGKENYPELLSKIPLDWQHRCHQLVEYGAQFMVTLYDGRRGNEKIEDLRRDQWEKKVDDVWNFTFWQKKTGLGSKNHQKDSENVAQSGILPFLDITEYLNPGQFFEDWLEEIPDHSTNPKTPNGALFPKPKDTTKNFRPHHPDTVLFEPNRKLGKHMVQEMLPTVSESILMLGRCTNHQMRVTVVKTLRRAGYDWPTIQKITGHKSIKSLIENYDPSLDTPERANIGVAIGSAPNLRRGIEFQKVSSSLTRNNLEGLVSYNEPEQMVPMDLQNETNESPAEENEEKLYKKPKLDNFQMNNPLFDYGPPSSTDGGLFKLPESPKKAAPTEDTDEDNFEIPKISAADLGDEDQGYNLKGRLKEFMKYYTQRRGQLAELGRKMREAEEKRWKEAQIDYVNKAIHASNASKLDIEIANSILRQKEEEERMSKERERQKREEVKKKLQKYKYKDDDSLITVKKEKSETHNQTKKSYESIDLTLPSNRAHRKVIPSKSPMAPQKDHVIDLTISPEARGIKLEDDMSDSSIRESSQQGGASRLSGRGDGMTSMRHQNVAQQFAYSQMQTPYSTNFLPGNSQMMLPNFHNPQLSQPYLQQFPQMSPQYHQQQFSPQMSQPYHQQFPPQMSPQYHQQFPSQITQQFPSQMSPQYHQPLNNQQMVRESRMEDLASDVTREQGLGLGQVVQQVTEKSLVRLQQGGVQATTVSMSATRKRYPDWGALADNKKR